MNIRKTLIVSLMATAACGWLQAESLTFNFTTLPTSVSYAGGPAAFTTPVGGIGISGVSNQHGTLNSSCTNCSISFATGAATSIQSGSLFGLNEYQYTFGSSGSSFSVSTGSGVGSQLNSPNSSSSLIGANQTLANGSLSGFSVTGGQQAVGGPATFLVSIPLSAVSSANLLSIFGAFGLATTFPDNGTLTFNLSIPNSGLPTGPGYAFNGQITGGSLSLDASVTPEPSSVLLIGFGLIGVAFIGRKRILAHRL